MGPLETELLLVKLRFTCLLVCFLNIFCPQITENRKDFYPQLDIFGICASCSSLLNII